MFGFFLFFFLVFFLAQVQVNDIGPIYCFQHDFHNLLHYIDDQAYIDFPYYRLIYFYVLLTVSKTLFHTFYQAIFLIISVFSFFHCFLSFESINHVYIVAAIIVFLSYYHLFIFAQLRKDMNHTRIQISDQLVGLTSIKLIFFIIQVILNFKSFIILINIINGEDIREQFR